MKKIIRCAASVVLAMSFLAGLIPANLGEFLGLPGSEVRADDWVEVSDQAGFIAAFQAGGNIRITDNIIMNGAVDDLEPANDIVLDLNGYRILYDSFINLYCSMTIIDNSELQNGQITTRGICTTSDSDSALHIDSGAVSSTIYDDSVRLNGGTFTMTGGTVETYLLYQAEGSYSITGGRFRRDGMEEHSFRRYLAEGYYGTSQPEEDGYYHVYQIHSVTLTGGENATTSGGSTTQQNILGPMTPVVYTANSGYHFTAFEDITENGITVTRTDSQTITVSGTPTDDVEIDIPGAVADWVVVYTADDLWNARCNLSSIRLGADIDYPRDILLFDYDCQIDLNGHTLIMDGGKGSLCFIGEGRSHVFDDRSESGDGVLNGALYVGFDSCLRILGGTVNDVTYASDFMGATVLISGGRFNFDPTNWVEDNYRVEGPYDGFYSVFYNGWEDVTNYTELMSALEGSNCIRLAADIIVPDEAVNLSGTIDLNGHTLTINNGAGVLRVAIGSSGVICDTSAEGNGTLRAGLVAEHRSYLHISGGIMDCSDCDPETDFNYAGARVFFTGGRLSFHPIDRWVVSGYRVEGPDDEGFYDVIPDYSPELGLLADSSKMYLIIRIPYVDGVMPEVTWGGEPVTLTPSESYGYFTIECAMKNMTDETELIVSLNGQNLYDHYISVSQYLRAVMNTHPDYRDMIIALLRYGSAAQICLNYPASGIPEPDPRLANYGIIEAYIRIIRDRTIPADGPSADAISYAFNNNLTHSEYYGMNLTYTYDTSLLIAFRITDGTAAEAQEEIESYFAQWTTNDSPDYKVFEDASHNYIIVKILNVPIKKLGDTLFLVDPAPDDTYDQQVPIRIIDYLARVTSSDSGKSQEVTDLCRSLYVFYQAVMAGI